MFNNLSPIFLYLPLSLSHTHTHTQTYSHTLTHSNTQTSIPKLTHTHTCTLSYTLFFLSLSPSLPISREKQTGRTVILFNKKMLLSQLFYLLQNKIKKQLYFIKYNFFFTFYFAECPPNAYCLCF